MNAAGGALAFGAESSHLSPGRTAISALDPVRRRVVSALAAAGAGALLMRTIPAVAERMQILSRAIPKSGESLPVIGLGTWQEFDIGDDAGKRKEAEDTVRTFVSEGLRVVDTSPMYGSAEAVAGELFDAIDTNRKAFIATKVWTSGAESGRRQIENSFRLLRRERLDLIQVHNLRDADAHLSTLAQLKHDGRVRYVGVTHYNASGHAELVRYIERGDIDFVQVNYSLLEREAETSVLPAALANHVAVLINRPLAQGALFGRVRGRALPPIATDAGATTWAQFALKWIVAHPAVTCVIPGTRNPAHLLDNVGAGQGVMPDAAMRAKMLAAFDAA
jgi:aryl-alcohol dehydrogenase-like predicted oxidoreductase